MIKWLFIAFGLFGVFLFAGTLYVRLASHDPAQWHVDPATVTEVETDNQYLDSAVLPGDTQTVVARLSKILGGEVIGGSFEAGFVTLVVRTPLYGYPDYVSMRISEEGEASTRVAMFSRSRFGKIDFGANKARVETIFAKLRSANAL